MKIVKEQGFIPRSGYESKSDEESDEYETDYESDNDDNYGAHLNGNINNHNKESNHRCSNIDNNFVVEDPFFEVKEEDIEFEEEATKHESQTIHLKNGFILCGKFRKKRRVGFGSLSGSPLEEKGMMKL